MWYILTLIDFMIVALGMYLSTISGWMLPVALLLVGVGQHRLTLMAHDGAHGNADGISTRLILALFTVGSNGYKGHHFLHHREVGTVRDPEKDVKKNMWLVWSNRRLWRMWQMPFDMLGFGALNIYSLLVEFWKRSKYPDALGVGILWTGILMTLYVTHSFWILGVWTAALFSTFWAVFRQRMLIEHCNTGIKHPTRQYNALWWEKLLYLPHNTDLHFEHHRNPWIPCWRLKR